MSILMPEILKKVATRKDLDTALKEYEEASNRLADAVREFLNTPINQGGLDVLQHRVSAQRANRRMLQDIRKLRREDESFREYVYRQMVEARMVPDVRAGINCGPLEEFDKLVAGGMSEIDAAKESWFWEK